MRAKVPLTFPSHQGLILPIWRRWPAYFDVTALCVGAAMPDIVDGLIGTCRGYLGQGYGHTLIGLFLPCLPGGLILTWLARILGKRTLKLSPLKSALPTWVKRFEGHVIELPNHTSFSSSRFGGLLFWSFSVCIGAFSHLFFDLISHRSLVWFYPWYENHQIFPSWWYVKWAGISLPFYRTPYPLGPHALAWIMLTIIGAVLFFRLLSCE